MHCYFQELEESRTRTTTHIEEVDGRLEGEYEARLLEALREIRSQHEIDIQTMRNDLETLYENKVNRKVINVLSMEKLRKSVCLTFGKLHPCYYEVWIMLNRCFVRRSGLGVVSWTSDPVLALWQRFDSYSRRSFLLQSPWVRDLLYIT